jgi:hypothetical protein
MRGSWTVHILLLGLAGLISAQEAGDDKKDPPPAGVAVGRNVPGSFHPYNVTARTVPLTEPEKDGKGEKTPRPDTKGKYHCLVTEYDLDPVVVLFLRNADEAPAVKALLQKLDAAMDSRPSARLRAFAVALLEDQVDKDGKKIPANVTRDDDQRKEAAERLSKLADELKLRGVVLTVAAPSDVEKWKLDTKSAANVVAYKRLKVQAVHNLGRDQLEKAESPEAAAVLESVQGLLEASKPGKGKK